MLKNTGKKTEVQKPTLSAWFVNSGSISYNTRFHICSHLELGLFFFFNYSVIFPVYDNLHNEYIPSRYNLIHCKNLGHLTMDGWMF